MADIEPTAKYHVIILQGLQDQEDEDEDLDEEPVVPGGQEELQQLRPEAFGEARSCGRMSWGIQRPKELGMVLAPRG